MIDTEEKIETFLTWVMANRDVGAREWSENIEPELRKQLDAIILQQVKTELELINDKIYDTNKGEWGVPTKWSKELYGTENHADLWLPIGAVHEVIDNRIRELQALQTKEKKS